MGGGQKRTPSEVRFCPPIASNDALGKGLTRTKQGNFWFFSVRFDKQSFFLPNGTVYDLRSCVFRDKNAVTLRCIRLRSSVRFSAKAKNRVGQGQKRLNHKEQPIN